MRKVGILCSHPVQYYAPWFSHLSNYYSVDVYYAFNQDSKGQSEAGFGVEFEWDTPLLEGYNYHWLKNISKNPGLGSFFGCDTPEINDIIKNADFDAFLVFGWNYKGAIQAIRACWKNNVPALMRGDSQLITKRSIFKTIVKYFPYRWFLPRIDAHLYVGKRNKDYLKYYGVREEQLFFVPHFVDNDYFIKKSMIAKEKKKNISIRDSFKIPHDAFVLLFVGKFIDKKRPSDFIHACIQVFQRKASTSIHAILVGDGPLKAKIRRLSSSYNDRIHFAGFRNQSELPSFYAASNVLALTSDSRETWGVVVNEAMACGLPVVVSDSVGCTPDLIDEGRTGYKYTNGNIKELSSKVLFMKDMLNTKPTVVMNALIEKIDEYSMEKATNGLMNALNYLMGKS